MSINPDHQPTTRPLTDSEGNPLPPMEVRSPEPNFGDDAQGARIREANRRAENQNQKQGFWTKGKIAVAGGVAVVATGLVGAAAGGVFGGSEKTAPDQRPTASAPEKPSATEEYKFGLSTAEYANNPEALATAYYDQQNAFQIAGATEEAANADKRFEMPLLEYVDYISKDIDAAFVDAFLIDNWQDNPHLVAFVDANIDVAHSTRALRLTTYSGGTEDKEPYVREVVLDEVSGTVDPLTTSARWHGRDNSDMNTAEESATGVDPNTETGGSTFTWVDVDGELKISDVTYNAD